MVSEFETHAYYLIGQIQHCNLTTGTLEFTEKLFLINNQSVKMLSNLSGGHPFWARHSPQASSSNIGLVTVKWLLFPNPQFLTFFFNTDIKN
jgi:hypothetical protein